ncbi:DUF2087 domain-containing protein [uncultured Microbacterium sp.]|uniref:DUF2087 domain-containing protein n=1 Tax=uncultured Microbacterium sp. TaxID=191216 RepID=UPI0025F91829|nr:DUF2087 domain-containing protein [uncultured Microbacterium sp.]
MNENAWRAVVAALADERARAVYARIVLQQDAEEEFAVMSPGKRRRVLGALEAAGLVIPSPDGGHRAVPDVFARTLASAPAAERPTGIGRFFVEGRLSVYPARDADRRAVLEHIASRLLAEGETVDEAGINERLSTITDDAASMRRYLVDAGLLVRTAAGTRYSRA